MSHEENTIIFSQTNFKTDSEWIVYHEIKSYGTVSEKLVNDKKSKISNNFFLLYFTNTLFSRFFTRKNSPFRVLVQYKRIILQNNSLTH